MNADDRRAYAMAAGLGTMGALHLLAPKPFDEMIPKWMPGRPRTSTYLSGLAEIIGAVLIVPKASRRVGGYWCAATMASVYPANVQAALDGGMKGAPPPFDTAAAAWIRLPFQVPMVRQALRVARSTRPVVTAQS